MILTISGFCISLAERRERCQEEYPSCCFSFYLLPFQRATSQRAKHGGAGSGADHHPAIVLINERQYTATQDQLHPGIYTTPTIPTVTVSENTNCRTGPGKQYDQIDVLEIGQSAVVVGKNTSTNY